MLTALLNLSAVCTLNLLLFLCRFTHSFDDKAVSTKVSHIFFEVEDKELSKCEDYHLNVMVVTDTTGDEKDKIEDAYFEVFDEIEGVKTNLRVVTEDEVTLNDLHNYKRWNWDSISYSKNQSLPVDEIDKII